MIRIPYFLILAFLFVSNLCNGGGEYRIIGAKAASLGYTSVSVYDLWSGFNNQAGLALLQETSVGIYHENRYLVKELGLSAATFNLPTHAGTVALSVTYFGFNEWNESKVGFAYARAFGDRLAVGAQLDYCLIHQDEHYSNLDFITFEVGMLIRLSDKVMLGLHTYNPINASISEYTDEKSPSTFRLGTSYKVSDKFLLTGEIEKCMDKKAVLKTGVQYAILPSVFIRTGISTNPSLWAFGAGLGFRNFTIDLSTTNHYVLGFSPQVSLSYRFK